MKIIFLLILVFGITSAEAQIILKGVVKDEQNQSLPSATVRLKRLPDSSAYKNTQTDTVGRFSLKDLQPGSYQLTVTSVGYQSFDQQISAANTDIELRIQLRPAVKDLKEIAIRSTVSLVEKQIDKTVVNVGQSLTATGTNALELLKKLPGNINRYS